jgi:hypothetical protein
MTHLEKTLDRWTPPAAGIVTQHEAGVRWHNAAMARRGWRVHQIFSGAGHLLVLAVVAMQGALLLALWWDASQPPPRFPLAREVWGMMHKTAFYPLAALLTVGLGSTWLGLGVPGPHRWKLVAAWAVFLPVVIWLHGPKLVVMFDLLWHHG